MNEFSDKFINLYPLFKFKKSKLSEDPVECKRLYNLRYRLRHKSEPKQRGRPKKYSEEEKIRINRERAKLCMRRKRATANC